MTSALEIALTKQFKDKAMHYLAEHPEEFEEVIQLALSNRPKICWRAAWLINGNMTQHDARITPYIDQILEVLPHKEDGHQRELIKILDRMKLSEDQEGLLFDHCVTVWESVRMKPGTRHSAFKMMMKVAAKYPELKHEILVLTQPQFINSLSPGIKNSVRKLVAELE